MKKKAIVLSGVSINSGGPLTIYKEILSFLSTSDFAKNFDIVAIVHDEKLFINDIPNVKYISIPKADNWLIRLYYEYFGLKKISKTLNSYLWLSLQVATPNVKTEKQAIYIHNPSPFYKWKLSDFIYGSRYILFAIFFKYIYKINLKRNNYLIVQQSWLRDEFSKMYNIDSKRIIVSYPKDNNTNFVSNIKQDLDSTQKYVFIYPALPRIFKNYEVICEAVKKIKDRGLKDFKVILTIDGSENKYSKSIFNKYSYLKEIEFIGLVSHNDILSYYINSNCLLFPSKLETWGLPISEFTPYNKPMLIADLPYAHETASGANLVYFFDPDNSEELSQHMEKLIKYDKSDLESVSSKMVSQPFTTSWTSVFDILMK